MHGIDRRNTVQAAQNWNHSQSRRCQSTYQRLVKQYPSFSGFGRTDEEKRAGLIFHRDRSAHGNHDPNGEKQKVDGKHILENTEQIEIAGVIHKAAVLRFDVFILRLYPLKCRVKRERHIRLRF